MSNCYEELLKGAVGKQNNCGKIVSKDCNKHQIKIELDSKVFDSVSVFFENASEEDDIKIIKQPTGKDDRMEFSRAVSYIDQGRVTDAFNIISESTKAAIKGTVDGVDAGGKFGFVMGLVLATGVVLTAPVSASAGALVVVSSAVVGATTTLGAATGGVTYSVVYSVGGAIEGVGKAEKDQIAKNLDVLKSIVGECPTGFDTQFEAYIPKDEKSSIYTGISCIPNYTKGANTIISDIEFLKNVCKVKISKEIVSCITGGNSEFHVCRDRAFSEDVDNYKPYKYNSHTIDCDTREISLVGDFCNNEL